MAYTKQTIGGKDVYVVEAHHHVLGPWSDVRRRQLAAPALVSLDHHADTDGPFDKHVARFAVPSIGQDLVDAMESMAASLVAGIDFRSPQTVDDAIQYLHNDEHIVTAIKSDIVARAFIITQSPPAGIQDGGLYVAAAPCAIECSRRSHADCGDDHSAQVLESIYLNHEIQDLKGLAKAAGVPEFKSMPYILDIDLDYFHSERSIEPVDSNTFYQLICNALAVTIATEPWYVDRLKIAGSTITAEWLLERMTRHIEAAMT